MTSNHSRVPPSSAADAAAPPHRVRSLLLRLTVTVVILSIVLYYIDVGSVLGQLRSVSLLLLAGAVGLRVAARVLTVLKWKVCLDASGIHLGFWPVLRIVSISGLIGLALPSGLGADAVRLVYLRQMRHALTRSAGTILADRLVGVLVMAGASAIGTLLMWQHLRDSAVGAVLLLASAGIWLVTAVVLCRPIMQLLHRIAMALLGRVLPAGGSTIARVGRLMEKADLVHQSLHDLMRNPRVLGKLLLLGVLMLVARVAIVDLLFRGVGSPVPFTYGLAFIPMIFLLTLLPVSLFGLGVGEGAFIYFFRAVGIVPATALAVSLLTHAVNLLLLIAGGVPFLLMGDSTTRASAAAQRRLQDAASSASADTASP